MCKFSTYSCTVQSSFPRLACAWCSSPSDCSVRALLLHDLSGLYSVIGSLIHILNFALSLPLPFFTHPRVSGRLPKEHFMAYVHMSRGSMKQPHQEQTVMELEKPQFGVAWKTSSELSADRAIMLPELILLYLGLHTVQNPPSCSTDMANV